MQRGWIIVVAAWLCMTASAAAQQQQRDPFNGQFGVFEIASPPAEAARLAKLMGDAIDGLAPQRPGQLDVYVIAASLWGDPVFESEASQAEGLLRDHFGSDGRTILLSAGGSLGGRRYPAATPNNIAAAIGAVGAAIDPNEDLVVLFMTSHGSPDGSIALRENNRLGAAMRPTHLREMLTQAGIRNRVVIVSACYSGAFLAPLADENSIIMTAAAQDRTSFGCQPEREWTFFGEAYFNHALRGGASLTQAFDQAKTMIEGWEREQNLQPSNPQRYVGARAAELVRRAEHNAR